MAWQARARTRAGDVTPAYKLYVSPVCAQLPEAFGAVAAAVSRSASFQWKVGSDVYGLLRPDKIVACFTDFADLHATAADLLAKLDGCPAQGVPFTAAIESGRLLSWGIDPPSDEHTVPWLKRESWRAQNLQSLGRRARCGENLGAQRNVAVPFRDGANAARRYRPQYVDRNERMIDLTGSFVLPADAVLQPVNELPHAARRQLCAGAGDVALSRANSRNYRS